jgi:hypothetical protein
MIAQVRGARFFYETADGCMAVHMDDVHLVNQALTDLAHACGFRDTLKRTATSAYLHALAREGAGVLERLRRHSPYTEQTEGAP